MIKGSGLFPFPASRYLLEICPAKCPTGIIRPAPDRSGESVHVLGGHHIHAGIRNILKEDIPDAHGTGNGNAPQVADHIHDLLFWNIGSGLDRDHPFAVPAPVYPHRAGHDPRRSRNLFPCIFIAAVTGISRHENDLSRILHHHFDLAAQRTADTCKITYPPLF